MNWFSAGERIPPRGEAHGGVRPPHRHHPAEEGDHRQQDQGGEGEAEARNLKSSCLCMDRNAQKKTRHILVIRQVGEFIDA